MSSSPERARAKINLYLHVTGRRPDGYHLLDSLAIFAEAGDTLTLTPATEESFALSLSGQFGTGLTADQDNLVLRAAHQLRAAAQQAETQTNSFANALPAANFHLEKDLPVASGIGGGSADAAAALRLLTAFWNLPATLAQKVAPALGADVPVCLDDQPTRMEGIGEILTHAPAFPTELGMLLINPSVGVSTPAIFGRLAAQGELPPHTPLSYPQEGWASVEALVDFLCTTSNDLQQPAIAQEPVIQTVLDVLEDLPGTKLARMSGSGATCFALFESAEAARQAEAKLASFPEAENWWHWAGAAQTGHSSKA